MSSSSWRTSEALVAGIIQTDPAIVGLSGPLDLSGLAPFIDAANAMVTSVCIPAPLDVNTIAPPYSVAQLELIERWLAAHFYALRDLDNQVTAENAGDVGQTFGFKPGMGMATTRWGQTAMNLDYLGNLAALQKRIDIGTAPRPSILSLRRKRWGHSGFGGF